MDLYASIDYESISSDCFIKLPPRICSALKSSHLPIQIVKCGSRNGMEESCVVSWAGGMSKTASEFTLSWRFAEMFGFIKEDESKYTLKAITKRIPNANSITVKPIATQSFNGNAKLSEESYQKKLKNEWEVICLNAQQLEKCILEQIRVVYKGLKFPIRIGEMNVAFEVTRVEMNQDTRTENGLEVVLISQDTEFIVEPPAFVNAASSRKKSAKDAVSNRPKVMRVYGLSTNEEAVCVGMRKAWISEKSCRRFRFEKDQFVRVGSGNGASVVFQVCVDNVTPDGFIGLSGLYRRVLSAPILSGVLVKKLDQEEISDVGLVHTVAVHLLVTVQDDYIWIKSHLDEILREIRKELESVELSWSEKNNVLVCGPLVLELNERFPKVVLCFNQEKIPDCFFKVNSERNVEEIQERADYLEEFDAEWKPKTSKTEQISLVSPLKSAADSSTQKTVPEACDYGLHQLSRSVFTENSSTEIVISNEVLYYDCALSTHSVKNETELIEGIALNARYDLGFGYGPTVESIAGNSVIQVFHEMRQKMECLMEFNSKTQQIDVLSSTLCIQGGSQSGKSFLASALASYFRNNSKFFIRTLWLRALQHRYDPIHVILSRIERLFTTAIRDRPSCIILDDIDTLCRNYSSHEQAIEQHVSKDYFDAVSEYIREHLLRVYYEYPGQILVVFTCKDINEIAQSLRTPGFICGIYSLPESLDVERRTKLMWSFICESGLLSEDEGRDDGFTIRKSLLKHTKVMDSYNIMDLKCLVERMLLLRNETDQEMDLKKCLIQSKVGFVPSNFVKSVEDQNNTSSASDWNLIGGMDQVKNQLLDVIELPSKYPFLYASSRLEAATSILLFGEPGCGKTMIAQAVAKHLHMRLITVKGPELLNKYIGASESAVRNVFSNAVAASPCILLFDEFESLAPIRGASDSTGVSDRIVNTFLTILDGVESHLSKNVYVIVTSSRPDLIDHALLRPGRIDQWIYCGFPNEFERRDVLNTFIQHSNKFKQDIDENELDIFLQEWSNKTEGYSGADLQALVSHAELIHVKSMMESNERGKNALDDLRRKSLRECINIALEECQPSVSTKDRMLYRKYYSRFVKKSEESHQNGNHEQQQMNNNNNNSVMHSRVMLM